MFHHIPDAPHQVDDQRNSRDPYGQYKRECEDAILHANPHACVARLGWQIDAVRMGNNMLFALDRWQATEGRVDSNADEGHSFARIVQAMKQVFGRTASNLHEHEGDVHDQRLSGGGALVPPQSARLPPLRSEPSAA